MKRSRLIACLALLAPLAAQAPATTLLESCRRADVVVRARLRHARLAGNAIETRGALAYRDPDTGTLVLWSSTQNPYRVRDAVAAVLRMPAEEVRVLVPDVGGGFGPKGDVYAERGWD